MHEIHKNDSLVKHVVGILTSRRKQSKTLLQKYKLLNPVYFGFRFPEVDVVIEWADDIQIFMT